MSKPKLLSGDELVARGVTKLDAALPEIGQKDVLPNGSWLEQKQIQAALEARKHLLEVERIEKSGNISHAEWKEELNLAEVKQKVGGHWQYVGHYSDKKLYLRPEEALFLMEVNCLWLTHNDITVSLQEAYSLLLKGDLSLMQYKVYASLSRIGYKVCRHRPLPVSNNLSTISDDSIKINNVEMENSITISEEMLEKDADSIENKMVPDVKIIENGPNNVHDAETVETDKNNKETNSKNENITKPLLSPNKAGKTSEVTDCNIKIIDENQAMNVNSKDMDSTISENLKVKDCSCKTIDENQVMDVDCKDKDVMATEKTNLLIDTSDSSTGQQSSLDQTGTTNIIVNISEDKNPASMEIDSTGPVQHTIKSFDCKVPRIQSKIQKLKDRRKTLAKDILTSLDSMPDLFQKQVISINVPCEQYIPKNIELTHGRYTLNLEKIMSKDVGETRTDTRTYSIPDEVNDIHVRRIRSSSTSESTQNNVVSSFPSHIRLPGNPMFRNFNYSRPRPNFYFHFNLFFPRQFRQYSPFRYHFLPRVPPLLLRSLPNSVNNNVSRNVNRKRTRSNAKYDHLENIKKLTMRLKQLRSQGNTDEQNVRTLHSLIETFNVRYRMNLHLTEQFDLIVKENIIDTIDLDDDEESKSKKRRTSNSNSNYDENLNTLKELASKLKELETKNKATARHRRAFSNALKTFNKSYNLNMTLSTNFEINDGNHITLECSSDSDCIIEETPEPKKGKMLRNPFNILKQLSDKRNFLVGESTSKDSEEHKIECNSVQNYKYSEEMLKAFDKKWLPNEDDFGRAEIPPRSLLTTRLLETKKEEYLYDFLKSQPNRYTNWLDLKISFLKSIEESSAALQNEIGSENVPRFNSIVKPEDCTDMLSVLKKLSIIQTNADFKTETSLRIDFDVYNRDVQNFRKSDPPKPHFRVICINESTSIPPGEEIAGLHSQYEDKVVIVFAIVGISSISYFQINPTNLPIYIPSNDLT